MNLKFTFLIATAFCAILSNNYSAQTPSMGSTTKFVLFSSNGPLNNTGMSPLTGDIGTNNGTSSSYNNLIGSIHDQDAASALASSDLLSLYNQLSGISTTLITNSPLGNSQVLTPGAYHVQGATTLNNTITLDGQNDVNALFVIKILGAFSSNAGAHIILTNGAVACNVFWVIEGALGMATGSNMKGTFIANNGAISLSSGLILEGRALSTTGAITTDNITANVSAGCNNIINITSQPVNQFVCPGLATTFSAAAAGTGLTYQWRIGTTNLSNGGHISGATSSVLHITGADSTDIAPNYNVVVTSTAAPSVTSTSAALNLNSVPVIVLQPKNQVGCVDYSTIHFTSLAKGTGLTYQWRKGNMNLVNSSNIVGANTGSLTLSPMYSTDPAPDYNVIVSGACAPNDTSNFVSLTICLPAGLSAATKMTDKLSVYPNPFSAFIIMELQNELYMNKSTISIYNVLGEQVINVAVNSRITEVTTSTLPQGVYFYQLTSGKEILQTGRIVTK